MQGGQPNLLSHWRAPALLPGVDGIFLETHDNPPKRFRGRTLCRCRNLLSLLTKLKDSFGGAALSEKMSLDTARRVLRIERRPSKSARAPDASFEKAVDVLFACKGRVVVTGMGKSV